MAKRTFQDIVPPEKRSIRNIPIPEGRKPRSISGDIEPPQPRQRESEPEDTNRSAAPMPVPPVSGRKHAAPVPPPDDADEPAWAPARRGKKMPKEPSESRGPRYGLWIVVFVVLLVLAFAISSLFAGATVNVTQKSAATVVSGTFTASRTAEDGAIPFDIIKVTRDDSKDVAASVAVPATTTSAKAPEQKATGQIVIYNNQSSNAQTLVANTRFETPDGLIYRIAKAVTIPGSSIVKGQKVPGSVEATVTADQPGATYNIGLVDFKIPGFKGDPRYTTIYARSKTPMTGGGASSGGVVSSDAASQVKDEIQYGLKQQLLNDAKSQIPENFTTFDSGLIYSFEDLPQTADASSTSSVKLNERGTLYAIIINKTALGQAVADRYLTQASSGNVIISNLSDLNFSLASSTNFNPDTDTKFDFTLNGNAKLVWQYDETALKQDLAGVSKSDVNSIMAKYPSIQSADVVVRPFWNRSLPKDVKKITIVNAVSSGQ
jgi:hypothetical protein